MAGVTAIRLIRQRRPIRRKHPAERPPVYQGDCFESSQNKALRHIYNAKLMS